MADKEKILKVFGSTSVLRSKDLTKLGMSRMAIKRLLADGVIDRVGHGLYRLSEDEVSENRTLVEVARRVPHGIICLLSALQFHDLTSQIPMKVWMAIDVKARRPEETLLPINIVYFSGRALTYGIENHSLEGVSVKITSPAKSVADCFKYRNKIGLDVALECLKAYRRANHSSEKLWEAAKVCRVTRTLRPYLEMLS
ncbi:MAG: type IV toxin-antitoxin system AbiEi family antitoxin domain-containing protein [Planctomycetota bacterium]|nr:type IV toxin-antitoxin system AbiEi family antitoxin domain-containing protein [Planctomycetota bacterium]